MPRGSKLHRRGARRARAAFAAALAVGACAAAPAVAGAADVTVRVEGQSATLVPPTVVTIGDGTRNARTWNGVGTMPRTCADNTAYQAFELATRGNWDRGDFTTTVMGESHTWVPNEEYWIFYYNDDYADWGICQRELADGDTILFQAGVSGTSPDFIPDAVPIALERTDGSGNVTTGGSIRVKLTEWRPTDIFGTPDPSDPNHWIIPPSPATHPAGYTVTAGGVTAVTDANGEATLRLTATGLTQVQASKPGHATNWSRSVPFAVCVVRRGGSGC